MRRILQDNGAEVIHLGHNRSVAEVIGAALQEGVQGICVSSYQGGHLEYFKYMKDLLDQCGAGHIRIFGGGGGVIIPEEKNELENYGITKIFHPEDGRRLGLEGMILEVLSYCDFDVLSSVKDKRFSSEFFQNDGINHVELGLYLTALENNHSSDFFPSSLKSFCRSSSQGVPFVLGVTGTGGAGKSSLVDELIQRFLNTYSDKKVAVVSVDPSKRKSGGALLGDRIRMNSLSRERVFMRSLASRGSGSEISLALPVFLKELKKFNFDLIIAETSGIGQGDMAIVELVDASLYVMTSEFGAQTQLEKIDMIDFADLIAINKSDRRGSEDALRDVRKQYIRSKKLFDQKDNIEFPVYLTQASQFNNRGVNELFKGLIDCFQKKQPKSKWALTTVQSESFVNREQSVVIPSERENYLAEIVSVVNKYKKNCNKWCALASQIGAIEEIFQSGYLSEELKLKQLELQKNIPSDLLNALNNWDQKQSQFEEHQLKYCVRGKEVSQSLLTTSLGGSFIPKVVWPKIKDWGDRLRFLMCENVAGEFPYTAGVFSLKRTGEDPTRMFAGEGTPEKTNRRFHYLSQDEPATRLSTAFDSVTLYGNDPTDRPDIFGKVGESGVSICTLNDMKKLYSGFDLCDPKTSVSMTINGPAPIILAFYFNTAIDQQLELKQKQLGRELTGEEKEKIQSDTLSQLRGTVQADILKEDQGQNTCIFSINFALKMMGDIQQYFIDHNIRNFYSVSISGYHIAEAGANPITQLAFTLANGFTYVEYYLSRGMKIDDFAPNLSFFFSNGLDPEYTVIGRVARRIWSIVMRDLYEGNERSQKLKYHIQTSGRSLHAQEVDFNDIRTTLQAVIAILDNCNSLHTNAYNEAITTPTEDSVRRAKAIQLIVNKEFGLAKSENLWQGSYFIEYLTELVEEAVLSEFSKLNQRGGVLGAMETQYQRSRIQEESLYYETLKHNGEFPIIGVNTFLKEGQQQELIDASNLARATLEEKQHQLKNVLDFKEKNQSQSKIHLEKLKQAVLNGENIFSALMSSARYCSLYQMTEGLYEVGGQYRRNI